MSSPTPLLRTPLHALHVELGAKMVPFAGYEMPVQYPTGVLQEHNHTRTNAGLFDVSHMGQVRIRGANPAAAFEALVPVDIVGLKSGQQRYALFTNEAGCILDDLMVARLGDELFVVVNAACKAQDIALMQKALTSTCTVEPLTDRALIALQGPTASAALQRLAPAVGAMTFMEIMTVSLASADCIVSRSGYTGEDGYEISVPAADAERVWNTILKDARVKPIGLGARDSLRLEAGLPLHGHDIDASTSPVEGALTFALSKSRKEAADFNGAGRILKELADGPSRVRIGLSIKEGAPAREGAEIADLDGNVIGKVTSGGPSPTLGRNIAMGYVPTSHAALGTELRVIVRGRAAAAEVMDMPFVAQRYHRKPKA